MLKNSLLLSIAIGVAACVPKKPGNSAAKSQSADVPVRLGIGYDTEMMRNKDLCITYDNEPQGTKLGGSGTNLTFERVESLDSKMSSLGFNSSLSLSYAIATGKASANFASSLKETAYSATYLLDFSVTTNSYQALGVKVKDDKKATDTPQEFRKICGDRYVSQTTEGGRLLAGVTFMFNDKQSKESFTSAFSVGAKAIKWGVESNTEITKALDQASEKTTLKITLNQQGGDARDLQKSFPKGEDVMICDLKNSAECKKIIINLFNYAINVFPESVNKDPYVYSFLTEAYPGLPNLTELGDATIRANKKATAAALDETTAKRQQVKDLISTPNGYGTDSRRRELQDVLNKMDKNYRLLASNLKTCVDGDGACQPVEELGLDHSAYDPEYTTPAGDLQNAGAIGGQGGGEVTQTCRDYLTGLHGESGWILDRAGAVCSDGEKHPQLGRNQSTAFDVRCPSGKLVTGVRGTRESYKRTTAVGSLSLICASKDEIQSGNTQGQQVAVFSPDEKGQALEYRCTDGTAAKGIRFRAGHWIDAIELQCVKVF
ncbi:MAG: hypothetical protein FJ146_16165 [Deltaproteobacteria bacterium]|nr:hypothetical protein [Deltaproteobacteria bacterium]